MDFLADFGKPPKPANTALAARGAEIFGKKGEQLTEAIFGNSPYLSQSAAREHEFFARVLEYGAENALAGITAEMAALDVLEERAGLMAGLRLAKRRLALLAAAADIAGEWELERVTSELSRFAEDCVKKAVDFLLMDSFNKGQLENPEAASSGLIVLGVGKLGGNELNYSSDIDLVILFDPDKVKYTGRLTPQHFFVKLAQELVFILQERTMDGYVFRTDLRLRPDPYSTPVAVSTKAAERYYETVGQNWERAAMIKARPIAGDMEAGEKYLEWLSPFIWRKYLDFAAVQDIHSIKRQIDSRTDYRPESLAGYNIKLGKGGIREIEFFAQTQQLIWGGRENMLRCRSTCDALSQLAVSGKITSATEESLKSAYRLLRTVEHRLQMVNDESTHSLPREEKDLQDFAVFMGCRDFPHFEKALSSTLSTVQRHYAELFTESPQLTRQGNLVFTGVSSDPETLLNLSKMGFGDAEKICEIVRGWHHGRRQATQTKRVREILTEITPALLKSFSESGDPDEAFVNFDEFLERLPTGLQLFTLFDEKPHLLSLIAEIMGNSPWLAENLSRSPVLINSILLTDLEKPLQKPDELGRSLKKALALAVDREEARQVIRRWKHKKEFQTGIKFLKAIITPAQAAESLSNIADTVLLALLQNISGEFEESHGSLEGGKLGIITLGKLGRSELTFDSDLDLVFVYPDPKGSEYSDGEEPLPAATYYSRLTQKFTSAIMELGQEGRLYSVDLRLRPLGNDGPLASSVKAWREYYQSSARSWEMMALTKARALSPDPAFAAALKGLVAEAIGYAREPEVIKKEMAEIREKIEAEHGTKNPWNLKYAKGGLFDVDFITQLWVIAKSPADREVEEASRFLRALQGVLRLTCLGEFNEAEATENIKMLLSRPFGKSFEELKLKLLQTEQNMHQYYKKVFGG